MAKNTKHCPFTNKPLKISDLKEAKKHQKNIIKLFANSNKNKNLKKSVIRKKSKENYDHYEFTSDITS